MLLLGGRSQYQFPARLFSPRSGRGHTVEGTAGNNRYTAPRRRRSWVHYYDLYYLICWLSLSLANSKSNDAFAC